MNNTDSLRLLSFYQRIQSFFIIIKRKKKKNHQGEKKKMSTSLPSSTSKPSSTSSISSQIRNQPLRKSAIGGVLTRQPDYEQRHLEMMRYLASIKHSSSSSKTADTTGDCSNKNLPPIYDHLHHYQKRSSYHEEVTRRTHESEVQRVRSTFEGRRRFKTPSATTTNNKNFLPHETQIDPITGLPRESIGTMNLRNHPGMQKISPWGILYQWLRQTFRSKTVLILILGFVLLLNLRRFGVLFQIHNPNNNNNNSNVTTDWTTTRSMNSLKKNNQRKVESAKKQREILQEHDFSSTAKSNIEKVDDENEHQEEIPMKEEKNDQV